MMRLYSIREIAEILGVSTSTVKYWIYSGKLKAIRKGRRLYIEEGELRRLIGSDDFLLDRRVNLLINFIVSTTGIRRKKVIEYFRELLKREEDIDLGSLRVRIVTGVIPSPNGEGKPIKPRPSEYVFHYDPREKVITIYPQWHGKAFISS